MKKSFTREFMYDNKGCYSNEQLEKCSFMASGNQEIILKSILESEIELRDKYWFVCRNVFTSRQSQEIAIITAKYVLEIYENKYPSNNAPREIIEAAEDYLTGTGITLEELTGMFNIADSAANAALNIAINATKDINTAFAAAYSASAASAAAVAASDRFQAHFYSTHTAINAVDAIRQAFNAGFPLGKSESELLAMLTKYCQKNIE